MLEATRTRFNRVVLTTMAVGAATLFALPLLWLTGNSFRPHREIFVYAVDLGVHTIVPREFTLAHFVSLATGDFARAFLNSVFIAGVTVVGGLLVASMAAFALVAMDVPGRGVVFAVVVVSFLVPFEAIAVPLSAQFRGLGLGNTYSGLILPGLGNGLALFVLRQFFLSIPRELQEAAEVDGARWDQVFLYVYLPLSKPAMIGAGLILFLFQWQSYLWPLLIGTRWEMRVAPVALAQAFGEGYGVDYGAVFAGALILVIVPAVVLLGLQRHYTTSIASAGLKG